MARSSSREDVQDRILGQMERSNRQYLETRNGKVESLKDQLEAERAWTSMSPEDQLRKLSYGDWKAKINKMLVDRKISISQRCINYVEMRLKEKYQKFHQDGTPLLEVIEWLKEEDLKMMNR